MTPPTRSRLTDVLAILLLLGLTVFFFWRILTPDPVNQRAFPAGDFTYQFYAYQSYAAGELARGRLPLWIPHVYGGHPFAADIQAGLFYPVSLIVNLLSAGHLTLYALEVQAIGHFFAAAVFTYLFVQRRTQSVFGGLVAGVTFAFGGYLTSYPALQLAILEVETWLPLVLLLLDIMADALSPLPVRDRGQGVKVVAAVLAGLTLGVSLLAGHPQAFLFVGYASVAYLACRLSGPWLQAARARRWADVARLTAFPALFLTLGLGAAAVQLLPTLEYMPLTTRATLGYEAATVGYNPKDLMQVLFPTLNEWPGLYVGIVPLILALAAPLIRQSKEVAFWGGMALFGLLLSLGGHVVLYDALYLLAPGFGIFRQQERGAVLWSLGVAILAGLGAAAFARPLADEARLRLRRLLGGLYRLSLFYAVLMVALYYVTLVTLGLQFPARNDALDKGFIVLLCLCLVTILLKAQVSSPKSQVSRPQVSSLKSQVPGPGVPIYQFTNLPIYQSLFLALIIFDLFSLNMRSLVSDLRPADHTTPTPALAFLRDTPAGYRVAGDALPGNASCFYDLEDLGGASPLKLRAFDEVTTRLPEGRLWNLFSVRYVATWRADLSDGLSKVFEDEKANVYERTTPGPRAWVVHRAEVLPNADARLARLAAPDFDVYASAILETGLPVNLPGSMAGSTAHVVERGPDRLAVDVHAAADGLLVLSENWYPGWQATVDGAPAPVLRADHTLRAVPIPAGDHRVVLVFDPLSLKLGALVTTGTLVIAGVLLILSISWPRRARRRTETMNP